MAPKTPDTLGVRLKSAREGRDLSLRQLADITKLSVRVLNALEQGRVEVLPSGIYRRSVVRSYAREVGLDPEITVREFLALHPDDLPELAPLPSRKPTAYDLPTEAAPRVEKRGAPMALLSVLGALIPIAAGFVYFATAAYGTAIPRQSATPIEAVRPVPPVSDPEIAVAANSPVAVMITVSAETNLQIVADGRSVIARRIAPGELVQFELSRDMVLTGDKAGAVHLSMNGRAGRRLGNDGAALDVRISREDYDGWFGQR
jgi:cytoskeletal protein RodZ